MQSSLIGKIEKAHRYALEPDRVTFNDFSVIFHGNNSDHIVVFSNKKWSCNCGFFHDRGLCAHTMALEKMFEQMLPVEACTNFSTAEAATA